MANPLFDIRDQIQETANDMAFEKYEADFYDLSKELQDELYSKAMRKINDEILDLGHAEIKRRRELGQ